MARARRSGGAGLVVATVLFAFAFLITLILSIILWAKWTGEKDTVGRLEQAQRSYVTRIDMGNERVGAALQDAQNQKPPKSLVQHLMERNRELKGIIDQANVSLAAIRSRRGAMKVTQPLLDEIQQLRANNEDLEGRLEEQQKLLAGTNETLQDLTKQKDDHASEYRQATAQVKAEAQTRANDFDTELANKEAQVEALDRSFRQVRAETANKTKQLTSQIEEKEEELKQLRKLVAKLRIDVAGIRGEKTPVRVEPDGKIVSLTQNGDTVYINLARDDRVQPGMNFEVLDKNTVIKLKDQEVRGKATIEIVNVLKGTSMARVVRQESDALIVEGDQIVNIAYDRDAVFQFFVHGEFDVNNRGIPSMQDNRRVKAMIGRWGGKITDTLTYRVDYLVLGEQPPLPEPPSDSAPLRIYEEYENTLRVFNEYNSLIEEAKKLNIPILSQNRFLALIGYYQR